MGEEKEKYSQSKRFWHRRNIYHKQYNVLENEIIMKIVVKGISKKRQGQTNTKVDTGHERHPEHENAYSRGTGVGGGGEIKTLSGGLRWQKRSTKNLICDFNNVNANKQTH